MLLLHANDNKNILMDIITKAQNRDISVTYMNNIFANELYYIEIKILVKDLETLTTFINDIESLPEVIDVERVIR